MDAGTGTHDESALAAVWSSPDWERCQLRERVTAAYESAAPEMVADFPMHPASHPTAPAGEWGSEITQARLFENPRILRYAWEQRYTAANLRATAATHQDHIQPPAERRVDAFVCVAEAAMAGTLVLFVAGSFGAARGTPPASIVRRLVRAP